MLITRGFGASASLLTSGFGPPPPTTTTVLPLPRGRRSPEQKDVLKKHIESIDVYTITAKLMAVNNRNLKRPIHERVRGAVDLSNEFHIKTDGKIRIVKTTPTNNIFINVSKVFRKK